MKIRFLKSDSGVITDYTTSITDYNTGTATLNLAADVDYLYIGMRFPFNHLYFKFDTLNTTPATMKIELWDSSNWVEVVETTDETSGFTANGYVTFVPDKYKSWASEDTQHSNGTERITGLGNVNIYDRYWARISFNATLDAGTKLAWAGYLFANDSDLAAEYPALTESNFMTAFKAGKTSYEQQHVTAAELLVNDLRQKKIIISPGQILDRHSFRLAAVCKCAEIVYNVFGDDYKDQKKEASTEYLKRLNLDIFNVDENNNAILDAFEEGTRQSKLIR